MARQALIDGLEANPPPSEEEINSATSEACRLSIDIIKTYSRLRHTGHLRFCGFQAVSYITAAAHTLIACMLRNSNVAFEHRPDLLTAIDLLLAFSSPFPSAKSAAQLLVQVSRTVDNRHGSTSQSEAAAIRVLARKFAPPPPSNYPQAGASEQQAASSSIRPSVWPSGGNAATTQQLDSEAFPFRNPVGAGFSADRPQSNNSSLILDTLAPTPSAHSAQIVPNFATTITEELATSWGLSSPSTSLVNESDQWATHNPLPINTAAVEMDSSWEDGIFSFLNDGLFDMM
jgi:hypothetical protein